MSKPLYVHFNNDVKLYIDQCILPSFNVVITYNSFNDVLSDMQTIRDADKSFIRIRDAEDDRNIYEFYNMTLGSTQILENGDGTITVHYYLIEYN